MSPTTRILWIDYVKAIAIAGHYIFYSAFAPLLLFSVVICYCYDLTQKKEAT